MRDSGARRLPVHRARRPGADEARAGAQRDQSAHRRRADSRREGHGQVDGRARAGEPAARDRRGGRLPLRLRPARARSTWCDDCRRRWMRRSVRARQEQGAPCQDAARRRARSSSCRSAPPRTACSGTLDLERAISEGERHFEPGLLAAANRGILYVDEVNLLADHLVDVLLDAAAMGVNYVEREGISLRHPAQFVLVGTMNPEEGDLRPQLLDRFALAVEVEGLPRPDRARRGGAAADRLRGRPARVRGALGAGRERRSARGSWRARALLPARAAGRPHAGPDRAALQRLRGGRPARRHRHVQDGAHAGRVRRAAAW